MAATVADQAQAVLDFEQWREERAGEYHDVSAAAYVQYLETHHDLARLAEIRALPKPDITKLRQLQDYFENVQAILGG